MPKSGLTRFEAAITSAFRLRNSVLAEVLLIAFVYVVGILIIWRHYIVLVTATPPVIRLPDPSPDRVKGGWGNRLFTKLPIVTWLRVDRREWLHADMVAGLAGAAVAIPKALAYAVITVAAFFAIRAAPALAQDAQELARAAKNPLANLISVSIFYDASFAGGLESKTEHVLTLQPVIPFAVSSDWSLITRTIMPLIAQPGQAAGEGWTSGLGDIQVSAFLSPARAERLVWGVGPVLQIRAQLTAHWARANGVLARPPRRSGLASSGRSAR